jgi:hypothetical protein
MPEELKMEIKVRPNAKLNQLVRGTAVDWKPLAEPGVTGVYVKVLRFDEATARAPTILLKFKPGATYPSHVHPGGEEIFVLGQLRSIGQRAASGAGDSACQDRHRVDRR